MLNCLSGILDYILGSRQKGKSILSTGPLMVFIMFDFIFLRTFKLIVGANYS
jgi:hypothetical protein